METSFLLPISRRDFVKMAGMAAGALACGAAGAPGQAEAGELSVSGEQIKYAGKNIPVLFSVDVCVAGGGPAGTAQGRFSWNVARLWEGWRYWDASIPLWILMRRTAILPMLQK